MPSASWWTSGRSRPTNSTWARRRHERLHRQALRDWSRAEALVAADRDRLERSWTADPPSTEEALAAGLEARERWLPAVVQVTARDTRPWWARRQWQSYDRDADRAREVVA